MPKTAYTLKSPKTLETSVIFASPHSGRDYSWSFLRRSILDERSIRSSEDAFVDLLFEDAPKFGAPLLAAMAPRAFIDLNRSADELDPAVIDGVRKTAHNPRISSGLGVIPRVVANGRSIYRGKLTHREAETRIRDYWRPYHAALQRLIARNLRRFGQAILVDCHSMPHEAIDTLSLGARTRPDIVLGDRYGAAAECEIVDRIEAAFAATGLKVARNTPFAGAFMAQHYGRPSRGQHVVQVEIDRSLYMNERLVRPSGNFQEFQTLLKGVIAEVVEVGRPEVRVAAE